MQTNVKFIQTVSYILYRYPSLPAESWRAQRGETPSFLKKHFYYHLNPAFSSLRFAYNFVKRPKQSIKLDFILYVLLSTSNQQKTSFVEFFFFVDKTIGKRFIRNHLKQLKKSKFINDKQLYAFSYFQLICF